MSISGPFGLPRFGPLAFRALAITVACVAIVRAQTADAEHAASVAQVTQTVERIRATSPGKTLPHYALSLGNQLLTEHRFAEAVELYQALLEKWPNEPAVLYGAALAMFNSGRSAEAEPLARSAVRLYVDAPSQARTPQVNSRNVRAAADSLVLLAVVLGVRGDEAEALNSAQRAVAFQSENFDAQFTLGRALYGAGNSAAAVKAFRAAVALKPNDVQALFFLATTLERSGDLDAALPIYKQLVQRQPQASEGHLGLGVLLVKRGGEHTSEGVEELRLALRINPNLYEAQVTLGRVLVGQNRPLEAIEHLLYAVKLAPENPEPHYQLARAYRKSGQADQAREESAIVKRIHDGRRAGSVQKVVTTSPNR